MNFTDRPNADVNLLRRVLEQREREMECDIDTRARRQMRDPIGPRERHPVPAQERTAWRKVLPAFVGQGLSDGEIAKRLKMSRSSVMQERNRQGIPANVPKSTRLVPGKGWEERFRMMCADGWSDRGIANQLGVRREWVGAMRRRMGLPRNKRGQRAA